MLASVSPASYLLMIDGQSCWGIFPLLLDFFIRSTFDCSSCFYILGPNSQTSTRDAKRHHRTTRVGKSTARVTIAARQLAEAWREHGNPSLIRILHNTEHPVNSKSVFSHPGGISEQPDR